MNDKIRLFFKRNKKGVLIGVLLLLNILVMVSFGARKNGYNVDELYTYGLSNSYFDPFIDVKENTQLSNEYIQNYFTVQNDEKFAYDSVYDNQSKDVHPPLYYFLFHTVSSLLPNIFSKWIGISINIVCFILAWIILYKLSKIILKDNYLSLVPPVLWGLSSGAISSVVFIRMYVLMTVFVLLTTYLHARTIEKQIFKNKDLIFILVTTFLGIMTHYYFVIFAFFLSACYFFYLLIQKKLKYLFSYVTIMFLSLFLSVLFYPSILTHIFSGYRGTEAVSSFATSTNTVSTLLSNFFAYYDILNQSIFSNTLSYLLVIIGILLGVILVKNILTTPKKNRWHTNENADIAKEKVDKSVFMLLMFFVISSLMYVFIIAQVAPYKADRYVSPIFPLIILIFVFLTKKSLFYFTNSVKIQLIGFTLFAGISVWSTYANHTVNYLYENRQMSYLVEKTDIQREEAILFYNKARVSGAQITNSAQYLYYHEHSYIFDTEDGIEQLIKLNLDEDKKLIYFGYTVDTDAFIREILVETKFDKYTLIDSSIGVYLFE